MPQKRPRRTQAERSAATRENLLEATVRALFEHGYGATTTIMVAKEAGVSRGAMLHHFPSKADLMVFVVEEVYAQDVALYGDLLAGLDDPRERLIAYPEAVWKVLSRPAGVAVLEILQGSRSDLDLAAKLREVIARIDAKTMEGLQREFPRGPYIPLLQLIVGAARGLSVIQVAQPHGIEAEEAIKLLQDFIRTAIEAGYFSKLKSRQPASAETMSKVRSKPKREATV